MKGPPRAPSIRMLSDAQLDSLQSFIEKHELEIELGKQKSLSFLYSLYKNEEKKKEKKEKYSKKLLKDAENLILSMQGIPGQGTRPSEPPPAYKEAPKKKGFFRRKALETEGLASTSMEQKIRKKLKELLEADRENAEKLVQQLLKRKDGEQKAEYLEKISEGLKKTNALARPDLLEKIDEAETLSKSASRLETIFMNKLAGDNYVDAGIILEQLGDKRGAVELMEKGGDNELKAFGAWAETAAGIYMRAIRTLGDTNPEKKLELSEKLLNAYEKLAKQELKESPQSAKKAHLGAIEILREIHPEKLPEFYKETAQAYEKVARSRLRAYRLVGDNPRRDGSIAVEACEVAGEFFEQIDPKKSAEFKTQAFELYKKFGDGLWELGFISEAAQNYKRAASVIKDMDPAKSAEFRRQAFELYTRAAEEALENAGKGRDVQAYGVAGLPGRNYQIAASLLEDENPKKKEIFLLAADLLLKYERNIMGAAYCYRQAYSLEKDQSLKQNMLGRAITLSILSGVESKELEEARPGREQLFSLWDNMGSNARFWGRVFAWPKAEDLDTIGPALQSIMETYQVFKREMGQESLYNIGSLFWLGSVSAETAELLFSNMGANEKIGIGTAKLAFYMLSLNEQKPGDARTYKEIILSLPENQRGEAMKRFLAKTSQDYGSQKTGLFPSEGAPQPKAMASGIIAYSNMDQTLELAEKLGIRGKTLQETIAKLDALVRSEYSSDLPASVRELEFSAREVAHALPNKYDSQLRGVLGAASSAGKAGAAGAIEKLMPFLERTGKIRSGGVTPESSGWISGKVPEGLLREGNPENVLQYLAKHQKEVGSAEISALIGVALRKAGIEGLAEDYARGREPATNDRELLYVKLGEMDTHLQDAMNDLFPRGDWRTLAEMVSRAPDYGVLKQIRKELYVTETAEKASKREIQLVFGQKSALHLMLGEVAGTCFGDDLSILLPKEVVAVPILEGGKPEGNILFLYREIDGKKSLVMFGFDPSEGMVMALSRKKRIELVDKLMAQVVSYCRENGFALYATSEGGGLSNRSGVESHIFKRYFSKNVFAKKRIEGILLHPLHQYSIKTAYPFASKMRK